MILTVTCNPAVDVTYRLPLLDPGSVHRVVEVDERPGGKGVNVARVLHSLDQPVLATGFADSSFAGMLGEYGVESAFVTALNSVRRTLVVQEVCDEGTTPPSHGRTTSLWEPGRLVGPDAAAELEDKVAGLLPDARAIVISGSLAPGVDAKLPARLALLGAHLGVPVIADLDGDALQAVAHGTAVLMPNSEELDRLVGPHAGSNAVLKAVLTLCGKPAEERLVVATLGERGMIGARAGQAWHARPVEKVRGNPTGAGDAAAAAVAIGLARRDPVEQILRDAVALSAAAVRRPTAGEVDLAAYRDWRQRVPVERLDAY